MLYHLGLYNVSVYVLTLFGLMQAQANVHDAFKLFKEGKYQDATQLIRKAKLDAVYDARDEQERTLLIAAVLYGNELNTVNSPNERFLLQEAAIDCILDKCSFAKMYIDQRDTNWQTPLMHAVKNGFEEIAHYLYIHGADPRIKDVYGKSARDYTQSKNMRQDILAWEWEYVEMMRNSHNIWRQLRYGMYKSALAFELPQLSDLELISMRDRLGNSLIHAPIVFSFSISQDISYPEKEELILELLDMVYESISDAESRYLLLDAQNKQGQTALMWAAKYEHERVIDWLHERGASSMLKDVQGRCASDYAWTQQVKDRLKEWQREESLNKWHNYV